jgi:hypothetical protein
MDAIVSLVDQSKFVPLVDKTEFPQLLLNVTTGAEGTVI